jgi:hypothetical protein
VKKPAPKAGAKKAAAKAPKPAGPGAIAAGGGLDEPEGEKKKGGDEEEPESYAATGIDNALDLLEVVTAKMDKASVGTQAAGIEKHPEVRLYVRMRCAFADLGLVQCSDDSRWVIYMYAS